MRYLTPALLIIFALAPPCAAQDVEKKSRYKSAEEVRTAAEARVAARAELASLRRLGYQVRADSLAARIDSLERARMDSLRRSYQARPDSLARMQRSRNAARMDSLAEKRGAERTVVDPILEANERERQAVAKRKAAFTELDELEFNLRVHNCIEFAWGSKTRIQCEQQVMAEMDEEAEMNRRTRPVREAVATAYAANVAAWNAEADYDFVEYDGFNFDKKIKATGAKFNAATAEADGSFAQDKATEAHLHVLRAQENASDMRRAAGRHSGGLKELANKAAQAWDASARAWEAVATLE